MRRTRFWWHWYLSTTMVTKRNRRRCRCKMCRTANVSIENENQFSIRLSWHTDTRRPSLRLSPETILRCAAYHTFKRQSARRHHGRFFGKQRVWWSWCNKKTDCKMHIILNFPLAAALQSFESNPVQTCTQQFQSRARRGILPPSSVFLFSQFSNKYLEKAISTKVT